MSIFCKNALKTTAINFQFSELIISNSLEVDDSDKVVKVDVKILNVVVEKNNLRKKQK